MISLNGTRLSKEGLRALDQDLSGAIVRMGWRTESDFLQWAGPLARDPYEALDIGWVRTTEGPCLTCYLLERQAEAPAGLARYESIAVDRDGEILTWNIVQVGSGSAGPGSGSRLTLDFYGLSTALVEDSEAQVASESLVVRIEKAVDERSLAMLRKKFELFPSAQVYHLEKVERLRRTRKTAELGRLETLLADLRELRHATPPVVTELSLWKEEEVGEVARKLREELYGGLYGFVDLSSLWAGSLRERLATGDLAGRREAILLGSALVTEADLPRKALHLALRSGDGQLYRLTLQFLDEEGRVVTVERREVRLDEAASPLMAWYRRG